MRGGQIMFKKVILKKAIEEGDCIPTGFRIAYLDFHYQVAVCFPIGVHLLVRWFVRLWRLTYYFKPDKWEKKVNRAIANVKMGLIDKHLKERERLAQTFYNLAYLASRKRSLRSNLN